MTSSPMQITQSFDINNVTFTTLQTAAVDADRTYFYVMTTESNLLHKFRLPAKPWSTTFTSGSVTTRSATSGVSITTGFTSTTGGLRFPTFPQCVKFNISNIVLNNNLCLNVQFQNCRIVSILAAWTLIT